MPGRTYLTLDDVLYIYADLVEEAAALWESLAMNQGFVHGNKRITFASALIFLELNGTTIAAEPDAVTAFIYQHLEARMFRKEVLDAWLRTNTAPL